MKTVLAADLNECRAGVVFPEYRDDLRLGEARLSHMRFLFGLSAGETHGINWPGMPGRRQLLIRGIMFAAIVDFVMALLAGYWFTRIPAKSYFLRAAFFCCFAPLGVGVIGFFLTQDSRFTAIGQIVFYLSTLPFLVASWIRKESRG